MYVDEKKKPQCLLDFTENNDSPPPGDNIHGTSLSISYRSGSSGFVVTRVSAVRFAALSAEEINRQGTAVAGYREESAVLSSPVGVTYSVPNTEYLLCLFTTSQLSFTVMADSVGRIC